MEEIWRDVKGYEGLYQVSNLGRVRSLMNNHGRARTLVLKLGKQSNGYQYAQLKECDKMKHRLVHRLVAEAFIPNPDRLPEVNHVDEDKTNNCVWNLEWCNHKYNINHGTHNERSAKARINHPNQSKTVYQYTKSGEFVRSYPSTMEAQRRTGIASQSISACCLGNKSYTHAGGYVWSYNPPTPTQTRVLF